MKTLKIKITDWWEKYNETNLKDNFIIQILQKKYNVVYSNNPDYVIFGPFGYEHLNYNAIKIFISGGKY